MKMFINERAARLVGVMLRETEARSFCRETIREPVEHTGVPRRQWIPRPRRQEPAEPSHPGRGRSILLVEDREEILAHGFDGYISKPIDDKVLVRTLHEVFNGSR